MGSRSTLPGLRTGMEGFTEQGDTRAGRRKIVCGAGSGHVLWLASDSIIEPDAAAAPAASDDKLWIARGRALSDLRRQPENRLTT